MTLNKKDDFGKIIGISASIATIIGTCIAVIALIPAFGQWLSPKDQSIIIQSTFTPVTNFYPTQTEETFNNLTTNTPAPTTIIPTNIPVEPKIIEQTDIYTIIVRSRNPEESSGGVKVKLYVGNEPSVSQLQVFKAIKDIKGRWVPSHEDNWFENYSNKMFTNPEPLSLESGMYVLTDSEVIGKWGNDFLYSEGNGEEHYLTFPVEENLVTEITLHFAFLEIGVQTQNDQPVNGADLTILCMSSDYGLDIGKISCSDYQYKYLKTLEKSKTVTHTPRIHGDRRAKPLYTEISRQAYFDH